MLSQDAAHTSVELFLSSTRFIPRFHDSTIAIVGHLGTHGTAADAGGDGAGCDSERVARSRQSTLPAAVPTQPPPEVTRSLPIPWVAHRGAAGMEYGKAATPVQAAASRARRLEVTSSDDDADSPRKVDELLKLARQLRSNVLSGQYAERHIQGEGRRASRREGRRALVQQPPTARPGPTSSAAAQPAGRPTKTSPCCPKSHVPRVPCSMLYARAPLCHFIVVFASM